jgi:methylated-DNA-[protein]-cysteine S-methyltransferase
MHVEILDATLAIDETVIDASPAEIRRQIAEYAAGDRRPFDLAVDYPEDFTGAVMQAMRAIPYGETRTYGDLAAALDSSAIAVGGACGRNPVPVVVPCHRVVGSDGSLTGYSGSGGVETKRRLLALEAENARSDATDRRHSPVRNE